MYCSSRLTIPRMAIGLVVAAVRSFATTSWAASPLAALVSADFEVLDSTGTKVIGHSSYALKPGKHGLFIGRGDTRLNDGEYDIENDTFSPQPNQAPRMLTLSHRFYNADGWNQRDIIADFTTG